MTESGKFKEIIEDSNSENKFLAFKCGAVQISRPFKGQREHIEFQRKRNVKKKMPHTNIAKLIYAAPTPKNTPTKTRIKIIHNYVNKNPRRLFQEKICEDEKKLSTCPTSNEEEILKKNQNDFTELKDMLELENKKTTACALNAVNSQPIQLVISEDDAENESVKNTCEIKIEENKNTDMRLTETTNNTFFKINPNILSQEQEDELQKKITEIKSEIHKDKVVEKGDVNVEIFPKKSLSTFRSLKSITSPKENQPELKKKSYNSEEAKLFIKTQRDKWKADEKCNLLNKERINKEEIKKRLQELHKNTLKILEHNLKKAKKRNASQPKKNFEKINNLVKVKKFIETEPVLTSKYTSARSNKSVISNKIKDSTISNNKDNEKINMIEPEKRIGLLRKNDSNEVSFSNIKDYDIVKENEKLQSLVNSKFNPRTNLITTANSKPDIILQSEILTSKVAEYSNPVQKTEIKSNASSDLGKSDTIKTHLNNVNKNVKDIEIQTSLLIPNVKLESKIFKDISEKSIQVHIPHENNKENISTSKAANKLDEIPYWLKPSAVEVYPYNFITAVRKKLEALTNPIVQHAPIERKKKDVRKNSNVYQETPLSHMKSDKENVRRRIIDIENSNDSNHKPIFSQIFSTNNNFQQHTTVNSHINSNNASGFEKNNEISNSVSEIVSNFSSISLHVPESNTITDMSSFKSDIAFKNRDVEFLSSTKNDNVSNKDHSENDDTTISSSVFSSPEKKNNFIDVKQSENAENILSEKIDPISPLSLENITNLQVKSKNLKTNKEIKENLSILNLSFRLNSDIKAQEENDIESAFQKQQKILELDQLLVDFNKSLSQVVEVNNQLKNTLDKSQMLNSNSKNNLNYKNHNDSILLKQSATSFGGDYTSDFEDDASNTTLTSVEPKQNLPNLSNTSASESNITSVEVKSLKLPKKITKSESSLEQNLNPNNSHLNANNKSQSAIELDTTDNITESTITEEIAVIEAEKSVQNENDINEIKSNKSTLNLNLIKDTKIKSELDEKLKFVESHINTTRGNENTILSSRNTSSGIYTNRKNSAESEKSTTAPPVYSIERKIEQKTQYLDSSVGSEFIAVYNKSDVEISMFLQDDNKSGASEATLNYSSIGMYEQLLQAENLKSEQLTALLKMREKVLIDRTKGQIAWLEVQKEKCKCHGLSERITVIKKKQRAILMKMEKEREEIKRLMNNQGYTSSNNSARTKNQYQSSTLLKTYRPKLSDNISNVTIRKGFSTTISKSQSSAKIIRGFDIGGGQNLEKILQKREEELKNRRQHVEHLMAWHQRLDKEEQEVFQLEQMLLECNKNNQVLSPQFTDTLQPIISQEKLKKDKKIAEIEKSLKELQNISVCSRENPDAIDNVRISGHKLNKLWSRLTGHKLNKFEAHKKYKFTKEDLEKFYEKAKEKVVEEFNKEHNLSKLLEQSSNEKISNSEFDSSNNRNDIDLILVHNVDVPSLHLNFSSESDAPQTLDSPLDHPIMNEAVHMNEPKIDISTIEQTEIIRRSSESLNSRQTILLSHELPEEHFDQKENLSENNLEIQSNEYSSNTFKSTSQSSNSGVRTKTSENMEPIINQKRYLEKSPVNPFDKTFVLKNISPEIQTSIDEQISSQHDIAQSNKISEEIKVMQLSSDSETNRQSVIVSLSSNLNTDLSKNFKTKSDLTPLETITDILPITKFESSDKNTPTIASSSTSTVLKSKTISPDQSIEGASNSTNNSTKPPSSISLENASNTQINGANSSTIIELISPSTDKQTVISNTSTFEEKLTTSEVPHTEKTFDKNSESSFEYENDFSGSDFTNLEDISMPKFETTMEATKDSVIIKDLNFIDNLDENIQATNHFSKSHNPLEMSTNTTELEKRLIDLDDSLKDLNTTIEKVLTTEKDGLAHSKIIAPNSSVSSTTISPVAITIATATVATIKNQSTLANTVPQKQNNSIQTIASNNASDYDKITLMPDIISEVEIRRRQQILIESEIKQLEHAMPYVVFREIPNKPPPPYVPPAHGSPMTTIFPSEPRIKEITFRRTAELFEELSKNDDKISEKSNNKNSVLNEHITNIYERIILDICKECMQEYEETLNNLNPESYKNPLALYNPPDRLNCMQEFIYSRVRKLLAMEKKFQRKNSIFSIGRKKRDHVDEILIQELFEEEYKWTNFDQEENEVKTSIIDEILNGVIKDVVLEAVNRDKLIDDDRNATKLDLENNKVQKGNKSLNDA